MAWIECIASGTITGTIILFGFKEIISNRLKYSIKHEYDQKFEEIKTTLQEHSNINQNKNELKKKACMQALRLANCVLSNYHYPHVPAGGIQPQTMSLEEARACIDELACTCESSNVLDTLKNILFNSVSPDSIVDLRNAIRKELSFSVIEIDTDRARAFIGKLGCCPPSKQYYCCNVKSREDCYRNTSSCFKQNPQRPVE